MRNAYEATVGHAIESGCTDEQVEAVARVLADAAHSEALAADAAMHAARHMGRMNVAVEDVMAEVVGLQMDAGQGKTVTSADLQPILDFMWGALRHAACGTVHHLTLEAEMGWTNR